MTENDLYRSVKSLRDSAYQQLGKSMSQEVARSWAEIFLTLDKAVTAYEQDARVTGEGARTIPCLEAPDGTNQREGT